MAEGPDEEAGHDWAETVRRLQALLSETGTETLEGEAGSPARFDDPATWVAAAQTFFRHLPLAQPETQKRLWEEGLSLLETVLGQYGIGPNAGAAAEQGPHLPRTDRRFADPAWRKSPFFAVLHQAYLLFSEQLTELVEQMEGLEPPRKEQARFALRVLLEALSPANFPLTNPVVLERAATTGGESLVRGMEHLLTDLKRGQLTHSDAAAFRIGENIATTPGKVIHQTRLYQLVQYMPATQSVLKVPLVIFPAWINRFYVLDLDARKSFVRWAVEQGISVFMVSWKSADESMADVSWDDYIGAEIEVVEFVCDRLKVPAAHVLGYCVAGTTLAAALAILARRGDAGKVKSATFLTAQVDFTESGDLGLLAEDRIIEAVGQLGRRGYVDGRYLAATFNLLRSNELIWNYVQRNYLLGENYPAFDLLHWNSDTTNLPVKWQQDFLRDLYRDNRLVQPDSLSACGTAIDLSRIETPCYVHAAREDHIAPAKSVWELMRQLGGRPTFVLAGSGHIAGVVNPPAAGKYRYWTNDRDPEAFDDFVASAKENPGSWWPHWAEWLRSQDRTEVPVRGRRRPGGKGDRVIEDAPGSYVTTR
jgi:polyhydroxyalkanoate synthase subunit PhaC